MDEDQTQVEAADRRAEAAKESLRSRMHELEQRVAHARQTLDLGARIRRHPRAAVGIAFGAGALLGLLGRRGPRPPGERGLGSTLVAALGALAVQALREAALREGGELARGWWADRVERDASRDPSVEAFLEH